MAAENAPFDSVVFHSEVQGYDQGWVARNDPRWKCSGWRINFDCLNIVYLICVWFFPWSSSAKIVLVPDRNWLKAKSLMTERHSDSGNIFAVVICLLISHAWCESSLLILVVNGLQLDAVEYFSPEQCKQLQKVGTDSDLYNGWIMSSSPIYHLSNKSGH